MDITSVNSDIIRGNVTTMILGALFNGDRYGYDILNEIEEKSNGKYVIKQPTLYNNLKRLEKQGLICSYLGDLDDTGGGRRRYYRLTDSGKETYLALKNDYVYARTLVDRLVSDEKFDFSSDTPPFDVNSLRPFTKRGADDKDEKPSETVREVQVEVIREVPVEVIREVPVEVVREVEVVKEVPVEVVREVEVVKEVPVEVVREVEVVKNVEIVKEVPVEIVREIEIPKEVQVETLREVPVEVVREVPVIEERVVEVVRPVEIVREVTLEKQVEVETPIEVLNRVEVEVVREVPIETIREIQTEKQIEIETPVEQLLEREVIREVPYDVYHEIFVEKQVETEMPIETLRVVEMVREVPVEVIREIEVVREVEVSSEIVSNEVREVEVIREVPIETFREVEVVREVPVEKIVYVNVEVPVAVEYATDAKKDESTALYDDEFEFDVNSNEYQNYFTGILAAAEMAKEDDSPLRIDPVPQKVSDKSVSDLKNRLFSQGYKMRPYIKAQSADYYQKNYIRSAKINSDTALLVTLLMLIEETLFWLFLRGSYSPVFFISIMCATSLFFLVPFAYRLASPNKRARADFSFKLSFLNRAMIYLELIVIAVLLAFFVFNIDLQNPSTLIIPIVLPIVVLSNIPLSSVVYMLLYRTNNYHISTQSSQIK